MKTQKIIALAVLLSVCYSFAVAAPEVLRDVKYLPEATAAVRKSLHEIYSVPLIRKAASQALKGAKLTGKNPSVVVYRARPNNPTDRVLQMAGMRRTPEGIVPVTRNVAAEVEDIFVPDGNGIIVRVPRTVAAEEEGIGMDFPATSTVSPQYGLLIEQQRRSNEMMPRWNPETGVWETTDGKGNIVPWKSLSNSERRIRWAQMEPSQAYLDLDSPVVEGTHFEMGENYESFLAKCDFYFYHPQFQQWMHHHSDGTTTITESTLKNGEVVVEDRIVSGKYMEGTILIPHMGEGTVYYFEKGYYWGEDPAPEHMKEVFDTGRVSTLLPAE